MVTLVCIELVILGLFMVYCIEVEAMYQVEVCEYF